MNSCIVLQQCSSLDSCGGEFHDMMRLSAQRHAAYTRAHNMDYWALWGDWDMGMGWRQGAWGKIHVIKMALAMGYPNVVWIDADAAIADFDKDLRQALLPDKLFGGVEHWADWFTDMDIPRHINVGVLFFRNAPLTRQFVDEWLTCFPGEQRWAEQGSFNKLIKDSRYEPYFANLPAEWNATVNVHKVVKPVIIGWHGISPLAKRLDAMKATLVNDFLTFKVV